MVATALVATSNYVVVHGVSPICHADLRILTKAILNDPHLAYEVELQSSISRQSRISFAHQTGLEVS